MDFQNTGIPEINMDGFQVVSGEMFTHLSRTSEATCTLWSSSIGFSKAALMNLNGCERIRIEINPQKRCILIIPVTVKDKDGIRWTKNVKESVTRKIECKKFASQLYELWQWDPTCVYRATGKVVSADQKVMMLFDFSEPESWKLKEKA